MSPGKNAQARPLLPSGLESHAPLSRGARPTYSARIPRAHLFTPRVRSACTSTASAPRVRGTISVFIFLLSFVVVIVHAPKGLSTLAAAARATSTGASSSADGASEAACSAAA